MTQPFLCHSSNYVWEMLTNEQYFLKGSILFLQPFLFIQECPYFRGAELPFSCYLQLCFCHLIIMCWFHKWELVLAHVEFVSTSRLVQPWGSPILWTSAELSQPWWWEIDDEKSLEIYLKGALGLGKPRVRWMRKTTSEATPSPLLISEVLLLGQ